MTRLLIIRHAESEWNAQGRWQGQADPGLSELGRRQARAGASKLAGSIERIVSSDLQRAATTADIIAEVLSLGPVERVPALREIDVGEWSGLTSPEIEDRWPGAIERWRRGEGAAHGGEDRDVFRKRILAAVASLAEPEKGPLLVVTHGAAIGVVERYLDVHPGLPVPKLAGRWFSYDGVLRADGDRVELVDEEVT